MFTYFPILEKGGLKLRNDLKSIRQKRKISQVDMAKMLEISYQNYRNYENGSYVAMSEEIRNKIRKILEEPYYEYHR